LKYLLIGQETERFNFSLLKTGYFDFWMEFFKVNILRNIFTSTQNYPKLNYAKYGLTNHFTDTKMNWAEWTFCLTKNKLVGQCGILIQTIENIQLLEIGYSILPEFWNQGFASESAIKCKNYAFENNFANSLISMIHIYNIGSEKVAIKNGMSFEKKLNSFNIFRIDKENWHY